MLDLVLPGACGACGRAGASPCVACWSELRPAPSVTAPPELDGCRSLLLYEGAARELVARLKYRNQRGAADWLARGMAELAAPWGDRLEVVTWAPTTRRRVATRGFDQAELLARRVANDLGLPVRGLLVRRAGPPSTGLDAVARRGVAGFEPRSGALVPRRLPRGAVLLVDDVVTTGATLSAAAAALLEAGVTSVLAVTAARTPLKLSRGSADGSRDGC